jgi:hypothetical protein
MRHGGGVKRAIQFPRRADGFAVSGDQACQRRGYAADDIAGWTRAEGALPNPQIDAIDVLVLVGVA